MHKKVAEGSSSTPLGSDSAVMASLLLCAAVLCLSATVSGAAVRDRKEVTLTTGRCADFTLLLWYHAPGKVCNRWQKVAFVIPSIKEGLDLGYMTRARLNSSCNSMHVEAIKANNGCWLSQSFAVGSKPETVYFTVSGLPENGTVKVENVSRVVANERDAVTLCGSTESFQIREWEVTAMDAGAVRKFVLQDYQALKEPMVYGAYQGRLSYNRSENCVTIKNLSGADSGMYQVTRDLMQNTVQRFTLTVVPTWEHQGEVPVVHHNVSTGGGLRGEEKSFPVWLPLTLLLLLVLMLSVSIHYRAMLCGRREDDTDSEVSEDPAVTVHILKGDID